MTSIEMLLNEKLIGLMVNGKGMTTNVILKHSARLITLSTKLQMLT